MAIIRRPNTNYIPGTNISIAKADNSSLDAVDVTISATSPKASLLAEWSGPLPTITGPGLQFVVPTFAGTSRTFNLSKMISRLSILPVGTTSFRTEKSSGGGAFSATSIATLSHTTSDYEKSNTSLTGTIASGQLVRIYFAALAGSGGLYSVQLQAEEV